MKTYKKGACVSGQKPQIYLVASTESPWVGRFRSLADGRYDLSFFTPEGIPQKDSSSQDPAKGVVVFYEGEPNGEEGTYFSHIRSCVHCMDLPLVAVTPHPSRALRAKLLAGGAGAVCDAEGDMELVVKEIENRCALEPVMEEIRRGLLDPFIEATVLTLGEMAGERPRLHSVYQKQGYRIFGDHSAVVSLSSRTEGTLVLSFASETSYELGRRMLMALGAEVTEELVQSCLGEVANVIVGQAKGRLAGTNHGFKMSVPTVVSGPNHEIRYKPGLPCLVASFTGNFGDFAMQLCMAFS